MRVFICCASSRIACATASHAVSWLDVILSRLCMLVIRFSTTLGEVRCSARLACDAALGAAGAALGAVEVLSALGVDGALAWAMSCGAAKARAGATSIAAPRRAAAATEPRVRRSKEMVIAEAALVEG